LISDERQCNVESEYREEGDEMGVLYSYQRRGGEMGGKDMEGRRWKKRGWEEVGRGRGVRGVLRERKEIVREIDKTEIYNR
jgi:hypothetical protein